MRKYEIMYIIRPTVEAEAVKAIVQEINKLFADRNSKVLEWKEAVLKDLAYEIQHSRKGYYAWARVEANNEAINEFIRVMGINENIVRHIVVKEEE